MALGPDSFRSARLKVQRANRHIQELDTELRSYSEGGCYGIDIKYKPDLTDTIIFLCPTKPIPDCLPLIVGDIVHNLRTAFDHVATAAYIDQSLNPDKIHFPFREPPDEFVSNKGAVKVFLDAIEIALPGARDCILNEIQPYKNGKLGVYPLNNLDGIDKHKQLILVSHLQFVKNVRLTFENGRIEIINCWFNPQEPTTLYRGPGKPTVECDFKAALDIRFDKVLPLGNEPVLPALVQLLNATSKALDLLEALAV
jgi:hypothetical protein